MSWPCYFSISASTRNLRQFQDTYEEENPPQLMTEILEVEEESSIIPNEGDEYTDSLAFWKN